MSSYHPATLPPIDTVEVYLLRDLQIPDLDFVGRFDSIGGQPLTGSQSSTIADLWRKLPAGQQKRCHIPPYGLRFIHAGQPILSASVCWRCNNIHGESGGRSVFYEFKSTAGASQELLNLLKTWVPLPPIPE